MGARSPIKLDQIFINDLKEYEKEKPLDDVMESRNIQEYLDIINKEELINLIARLCDGFYTGDIRTDIVRAAFEANVLAHKGKTQFYQVKSKLLEYIFSNNIWGKEPYNSWGIGFDYYNAPVIYFDVPQCGQVSFHLVNTIYDINSIPKYKLKWCGNINQTFPSYKSINYYHDLLVALGFTKYDDFKEDIAVKPINFYSLNENEVSTAYFMYLDECMNYVYNHDDDYNHNEQYYDVKYQRWIVDSIGLKKVEFSIKEGIISETHITDMDEKMNLLKQYGRHNKTINSIFSDIGINYSDNSEQCQ